MDKERLFTPEELEALGRRTLDVLDEALEAGEIEAARKLGHRMYAEFSGMHDLYRDWVTDLLTFVGRRFGDEVLAEALEYSVVGGFTTAARPGVRRQGSRPAAADAGHRPAWTPGGARNRGG